MTSYTITGLADSKYYVTVTAYDTTYSSASDDTGTVVNENQANGNESGYAEEKTAILTNDTTPPTVSATSPASGATGVALNTTISATFSETMDTSTITTSTFTLSGGITGTVSYNDTSKSATFTPSANLSYSTTYTATITTGVKDLSGNAMSSDYSWSFTATAAPDTTAPTSGSVNINSGNAYTNSTTVTLTLSATDNVGVTGYYLSTSSTTPSASDSGWTSVTSTTSYSASVSYTLSSGEGGKTVYAWFKDSSGNISSAASATITLDTTVPTVTISSPTSNSTYTATSSTISLGGSASDSVSGISSVTWSNNKGGSGTATGTASWTASSISLSSGDNIITVTAKDGAGNSGTDTITVTYSSVTVPTPSPSPTPSKTEFTNIKTINKSVNGFDIGDVDNDGTNELVVSVPSDKQVLVYDTQYKLKYTISFNESPRVILISDLDDDGKNELIVGTSEGWDYGQKGYAYVGKVGNNGNFSIEWKSPAYYLRFATEFAVGDLDSDGKKELVIGLSYWDRKLVSYEYTGSTYTKIFEDNIGSDVDSVFVADNRLFVGTQCWSDYGLRVYKQYSLEFSDTGDGITFVCAGDVNGDGVVEIIRGIGTQCGGASSPRPSFSIYDTNYSGRFLHHRN